MSNYLNFNFGMLFYLENNLIKNDIWRANGKEGYILNIKYSRLGTGRAGCFERQEAVKKVLVDERKLGSSLRCPWIIIYEYQSNQSNKHILL